MWPFSQSVIKPEPKTAYDFTLVSLLGGKPLPLSLFKDKVVLVVNTASKCGFTSQYEGLQKLYDAYKDRGLIVLGVPSDDFGHQEPGTEEDISSFCQLNYGVTFPMAAKVDVTGRAAHPFYQWARSELGLLAIPKWNFHKYLINRQGALVDYFHSTTSPSDKSLVKAVEGLLAAG